MTLELGVESLVLTVEIAGPQQAGAPLYPPQTIEASKLGGSHCRNSSPPRLRVTRSARARAIEDDELIPKRSARLAAKSKYREQKPEVQARKVMMKHLGIEVETQLPDEA
ncbi:unnamed protein product [Miscanthus lutarioriparius]|uniref:Uncharacterized protein n=1 Tax=Miscanthus lutarioriparius TaxID=422564 RepID=A0A811N9E8_9POAL|nr:unnamed protein product [Miscanthus lutarioriparius]